MTAVIDLSQFGVLLLDMNGTFMFGHDRFGSVEDCFATYRAVGGQRLNEPRFRTIWERSLQALLKAYDSPEKFDDFPTLREVFMEHGCTVPDAPVLERVFAVHEIGIVPRAHAEWLLDASRTHELGVVSNICAHPATWLQQSPSASVFQLFNVRVFSSEARNIKPSPEIFRRALSSLRSSGPILFIGDSLTRDIIPAKRLGMATAWIAPQGSTHPAADVVVRSLVDVPQ
jgi:putative hydrolase of the HAD superfamily